MKTIIHSTKVNESIFTEEKYVAASNLLLNRYNVKVNEKFNLVIKETDVGSTIYLSECYIVLYTSIKLRSEGCVLNFKDRKVVSL